MPIYLIFPLAILTSLIYFAGFTAAIIFMQPDYFIQKRTTPSIKELHLVSWIIVKIIKNVIGLALFLAGIVMLITPGQGLLTVLIGLSFLDFPGKRKLERNIICRPSIHKSINWIRKKANRPPIKIP